MQLAAVLCLLAAAPAPANAIRTTSTGAVGSAHHMKPRGILRVRLQSRQLHQHRYATPPRSLMQVASTVAGNGLSHTSSPPPRALVGSVFMGTPPQEFSVAFDTGSGNVLLPGKECMSVACLAHRSYDSTVSATVEQLHSPTNTNSSTNGANGTGSTKEAVQLSIGTGSLSGHPLQDTLCLGQNGELCAPTNFVEASDMSDEPFSLLPYDGILGLSLPSASIGAEFNFFSNLARSGSLESNRFAVWLAIDGDGEDAEVTFGAVSDDRVGSPDIFWQPLSGTDTGLWQVALSDVTIDSAKLSLCGSGGCQAALDTGTGVIAGPAEFIEAVLSVLNIDAACGNYDSLPMVGFVFGSITLNLDPSDYVQHTGASCFHRFMAVDVPSPAGPLVLLGTPFLQRYYSIYDAESLRVGLALARHKTPPGAAEMSEEEAVSRFMVRGAAAR